MGLFDKDLCIICGGKTNALTKAKASSGSVCSSCLSLCSPGFIRNMRNKDIEQIKEHMTYVKENQLLYNSFQPTDSVGKLFYVDKLNQQFYIPVSSATLYNKIPIVYSFDNIVDYELVVDGESYTKGGASIGRALVGGVLFGGVGTVIGGSTGKRKGKEVIKKMYIKISLKHLYDSYAEIPLISTEVKKGAFIYNTMTDAANKILALFDSMIANEPVSAPSSTVADELLKYKQLLDCGALSQEEFNAKKKELLNL